MSVLMAFTAQQMDRLSRISDRRLRYWEMTKVFRPTYVERRDSGPFRKIYTFRDLVSLRTLAILRDDHDLPLQELRIASDYLSRFSNSPWSELNLKIQNGRLVFRDPTSGVWTVADATGQSIIAIDLEQISRDSENDARKLMARTSEHFGKITRNRHIMSNEWVFSGTRIPVEAVVSLRASGMSEKEILLQYPTLALADIAAALSFEEEASRVA